MSEKVLEVLVREPPSGEWLNYYDHSFVCDNCSKYQWVFVLKGRRLDGLDTACSKCGCTVKLGKATTV